MWGQNGSGEEHWIYNVHCVSGGLPDKYQLFIGAHWCVQRLDRCMWISQYITCREREAGHVYISLPRDSQRHKDACILSLCDSFIAGCSTLQGKNPVIHTEKIFIFKITWFTCWCHHENGLWILIWYSRFLCVHFTVISHDFIIHLSILLLSSSINSQTFVLLDKLLNIYNLNILKYPMCLLWIIKKGLKLPRFILLML